LSLCPAVLLSRCPFAPAFQTHSDAIASVAIHQSPVAVATVSIPQWCDCCLIEALGGKVFLILDDRLHQIQPTHIQSLLEGQVPNL